MEANENFACVKLNCSTCMAHNVLTFASHHHQESKACWSWSEGSFDGSSQERSERKLWQSKSI